MYQRKQQATEAFCQSNPMLDLTERFKRIKMLKLKGSIFTSLKECLMTMLQQIENFYMEKVYFKKNKMEIMELKTAII